ncbi:MAG: HAD family hydrolase [Nitrososphaera sp.]
MNKAIFLDRDGVINKKRDDYVKNTSEFVMLPKVSEAIRIMHEKKFLVIIITNQSAVNRGLLTHKGLEQIHEFMKDELKKYGVNIDAIYYCPHRPDENCNCRKPRTELLEKAIKDYQISTDLSWFIGDSETDIEAAKKIGIKHVKIEENGSLLNAIKYVINKENRSDE